jgi:hypothetical protein
MTYSAAALRELRKPRAAREPPPGRTRTRLRSNVFRTVLKFPTFLLNCLPQHPFPKEACMENSICSICNKAIVLETAKTDEDGKAVHGECYLRRLTALRQAGSQDPPNNSPTPS